MANMITPLILLLSNAFSLILYFSILLSHNTAIASVSTNEDDGGNIYSDLVYPTSMAYEESFLRKMGNKTAAEKYIKIVVKHAQDRLKDESLGRKLLLDVKQSPRFLPNKWLNVDDESLDESYLIPSNESLVIFVYDNDTDVEMGLSKKRGGCHHIERRIILKWRSNPQNAGIVLAHEYGHLALGMFHDHEEDDKIKRKKTFFNVSGICDSGNTIMNKSPMINGSLPIWSECSRFRFEIYYNQSGYICLEEVQNINATENEEVTFFEDHDEHEVISGPGLGVIIPCVCGGCIILCVCGGCVAFKKCKKPRNALNEQGNTNNETEMTSQSPAA